MADYKGRVSAVVIPQTSEQNKYLVARRADTGDWEFPGGKKDPDQDDNLLDTAEREILEELSIEINAVKCREDYSYNGGGYEIVPVFADHNYADPDKYIELKDHTEFRWIKPESFSIELGKEIKCLEAFNIL